MKAKRWMMILLAMVMVWSLVGCGSKVDKTPVAKVGDVTITRDQLSQYISWNAYAAGYDLSKITDDSQKNYLSSLMLEQLIADEVIKQHCEKENMEVFVDTYQKDLKSFLDAAKENAGEQLKTLEISDETLTAFYDSQFYAKAVYDEIKGDIVDLDVKAKAYYDENQAVFTSNELYLIASHILVETETEAKEIKEKIDAGADFATLAKEKTIEPSGKESGGQLPPFKEGDMLAEFWEGANVLKEGEVSEPVKSQYGYHVIKLTDRKEPGLSNFEEVKTQAEEAIINQNYQEKLAKLKEEIKVEYLDKQETETADTNEE